MPMPVDTCPTLDTLVVLVFKYERLIHRQYESYCTLGHVYIFYAVYTHIRRGRFKYRYLKPNERTFGVKYVFKRFFTFRPRKSQTRKAIRKRANRTKCHP